MVIFIMDDQEKNNSERIKFIILTMCARKILKERQNSTCQLCGYYLVSDERFCRNCYATQAKL